MRHLRLLSALLVVGLLTAAVSCRFDAPTSVTTATPQASSDLIGSLLSATGLVQCSPLPYASDRELIGPAGGVLHLGPHTLTIPAGALSRAVWITGEAPTDNVNSVRFYPEGLQFSRAAALTMSYSNCNTLGKLLPKRIAYTSDLLVILNYLISVDDFAHQQVTGQVWHFSRYAVAW